MKYCNYKKENGDLKGRILNVVKIFEMASNRTYVFIYINYGFFVAQLYTYKITLNIYRQKLTKRKNIKEINTLYI